MTRTIASLQFSAVDAFGSAGSSPQEITWNNARTLQSKTASDFKKDNDVYTGTVRFWTNNVAVNPLLPTYMYAHGWLDSADSSKSQHLFNALKRKYSSTANIVLIDWKDLAAATKSGLSSLAFDPTRDVYPTREAQVTRRVGELVADAIVETGIDTSKVTLLGHSLGSFVVAHAANTLIEKHKQPKINELVAFDPAFFPKAQYDHVPLFLRPTPPLWLENGALQAYLLSNPDLRKYDTDGQRQGVQAPLSFSQVATKSSSYTVSDGMGALNSAAGDNPQAMTANRAYLVEYAPDGPANPLDSGEVTTAYHGGTINVYAELLLKGALNPEDVGLTNQVDKYNREGIVGGGFDGIVASSPNWSRSGQVKADREKYASPAFGWINRTLAQPTVSGTPKGDVMTSVIDTYWGTAMSCKIYGWGGSDILAPCQNNVDGKSDAVDELIGGDGADQFWIGHRRFGNYYEQYEDKLKVGFGDTSYTVISDFKSSDGDTLMFARGRSSVFWTDASASISAKVRQSAGGRSGVAVYTLQSDLICYVPGMTRAQFDSAYAAGAIQFSQTNDLDAAMLIGVSGLQRSTMFP
jgi:pimeloyl-ACP methyl ester carboxylesterase